MESQTTFTLKPSKLRHLGAIYLFILFLFCLGILASITSSLVNSAPMPTLHQIMIQSIYGLLIPCLFSFLAALKDVNVYTITMSDGMIEGPSKKDIWKRIRFPINRLIAPIASSRDFLQKIEGRQILCSLDGERILLNEYVFSFAQIQIFLQQLNRYTAPENQTVLNLEPSKLHYVRSKCLIFCGVYALFFFANIIFDLVQSIPITPLNRFGEYFGYFLLGELVVALLFSSFNIEKYALLLSNRIITGPSKKDAGQRISFAIEHLDRIATGDRNFLQKIIGERILYSLEGQKIVLNETAFSSTQIRALLQRLYVIT